MVSAVQRDDGLPHVGADRSADVLPGVPLPQRHVPAGPVLPEGAPARSPSPMPVDAPPAPEPTPPADEAPATADGYGVAAEPADEDPAPTRGRHAAPEPEPSAAGRRTLLLAAGGIVVVLAALALFVWPGLLGGSSDGGQGVAPGSASPMPTAPSVQLGMPDEIAGLPRITGAADTKLKEAVAAGEVDGLTDPVSGVYGSKGVPSVQVIAWNAVNPPEQESIAAAFAGFEKSSGARVSDVEEIPVGGLSGSMSCGSTQVGTSPAVLCFWADAGSFGSVTVLDADDVAKAQATAAAARLDVESAP